MIHYSRILKIYKILASYGVFKLNDYQLSEYNRVRNYAKNNDKRCKDKELN